LSALALPSVSEPNPRYPFLHTWDPARYRRSMLLGKVSEAFAQDEGVERLKTLGVFVKVVEAGGKNLRGRATGALARAGQSRGAIAKALAGRTDAQKGFPDTFGILLGRPWFIEWKRPAWHDGHGKILRSAGAPPRTSSTFFWRLRMPAPWSGSPGAWKT